MKKFFLIILLIVCNFNLFAQTKFYSKNIVLARSLFNRKCPNGNCQMYLIENKNDTFLIEEGEVFKNEKQGFWISYHKNIKSEETYYLNGNIEGIKRIFYESGKVERMDIYNHDFTISSIEFYENGVVKSESNYLVDRKYYPNGQLKTEQFHKKDSSSVFFNYCNCHQTEKSPNRSGLVFKVIINDNDKPYEGNEWYENGKKKVSTKLINRIPYIIEITQYDSLERPNIIGKMQHVNFTDEKYIYECFDHLGTWIFYNSKGEIEKSEEHKITTKLQPIIFDE